MRDRIAAAPHGTGDEEGDEEDPVQPGAFAAVVRRGRRPCGSSRSRGRWRFQPAATDMMAQITWFEHYTLWFIVPITLLVLALLAYCICQVPRQRQPDAVAHQPQHGDRGDLDRRAGGHPAVPRDPLVPAADRAVHPPEEAEADAEGDRQPVELGLRIPDRGAALLQLAHPGRHRSRRCRQGRPRGLSAPADGRQRTRRAGQHDGPRAGDRGRRHPRLRDAGLRRQDRRGARPHQRDLVQGQEGRPLLRPVLGAVRQGPRLHADRHPRRVAKSSTRPGWRRPRPTSRRQQGADGGDRRRSESRVARRTDAADGREQGTERTWQALQLTTTTITSRIMAGSAGFIRPTTRTSARST